MFFEVFIECFIWSVHNGSGFVFYETVHGSGVGCDVGSYGLQDVVRRVGVIAGCEYRGYSDWEAGKDCGLEESLVRCVQRGLRGVGGYFWVSKEVGCCIAYYGLLYEVCLPYCPFIWVESWNM